MRLAGENYRKLDRHQHPPGGEQGEEAQNEYSFCSSLALTLLKALCLWAKYALKSERDLVTAETNPPFFPLKIAFLILVVVKEPDQRPGSSVPPATSTCVRGRASAV